MSNVITGYLEDEILRVFVGEKQIDRYVEVADRMRESPLEANVETQRADIVGRFRNTLATANDVKDKMQAMHDAHRDFHVGVEKARAWMDASWEKIRHNSYSTGKSKEELEAQLKSIQEHIEGQEAGLALVQNAADAADQAMRNTRSDGKDAILQTLKELNSDWEKLTKKMATAKVGVESDLLQW